MANSKAYIVGIAGGSGSGKTTFLNSLLAHLPKSAVALVSQDNYYHPIEKQQKDENGEVNFDLPTSIDRERFHQHIVSLTEGKSIEIDEYTFNNDEASSKVITIDPAPIIITEGLFVFHYEEINTRLDYRIYIDAHEPVRLFRRIERDYKERGYAEDVVRYQWENHVAPAEIRWLRPHKTEADLVIDNTRSFQKELAYLSKKLLSQID